MNRKPCILLIPNVAWWIIGEMGKQIIARIGDRYDSYSLPRAAEMVTPSNSDVDYRGYHYPIV
jgi:hypothetical protein